MATCIFVLQGNTRALFLLLEKQLKQYMTCKYYSESPKIHKKNPKFETWTCGEMFVTFLNQSINEHKAFKVKYWLGGIVRRNRKEYTCNRIWLITKVYLSNWPLLASLCPRSLTAAAQNSIIMSRPDSMTWDRMPLMVDFQTMGS